MTSARVLPTRLIWLQQLPRPPQQPVELELSEEEEEELEDILVKNALGGEGSSRSSVEGSPELGVPLEANTPDTSAEPTAPRRKAPRPISAPKNRGVKKPRVLIHQTARKSRLKKPPKPINPKELPGE